MKARGPKYLGIAWMAGSAIWPLTALAQAEDLRHELGRCAAITEINARVACYDGLAHEQQSKPPAAKRESIVQPPAALRSEGRGDQDVLGKVMSFKEVQPNKLQITLGSGQVWQQTVSKAFFIRVDDSVRLSATGWGQSFRLSVDGHPDFIQVRRLR
jgi:hypothetical protein